MSTELRNAASVFIEDMGKHYSNVLEARDLLLETKEIVHQTANGFIRWTRLNNGTTIRFMRNENHSVHTLFTKAGVPLVQQQALKDQYDEIVIPALSLTFKPWMESYGFSGYKCECENDTNLYVAVRMEDVSTFGIHRSGKPVGRLTLEHYEEDCFWALAHNYAQIWDLLTGTP
jgi:hypothetical protein